MFDTHVHLDQPEFEADRPEVLDRAQEAGVTGMLCVGITATSSAAAVQLATSHPAIYAAVGLQPNYCREATAADWEQVVRLAEHPRVVAIGETGLDRYWDFTPMEVQRDFFARHLELARGRGLPVVIHCREAEEDVLPMLRAAAQGGTLRGILHAFSGSAAMAKECLELGLHISFAGNVSYTNKKFAALREVAATIPAERLLVETDAPYLVPQPMRGRQKRNEPAWLVHTVAALSAIRGQPGNEIARQTEANARSLLGL